MSGGVRFGSTWAVAACFGIAIAAIATAIPTSVNASVAEFCVTCKTPNASYRCRLEGSGVTQSDAFKLYCVVRTSKEGNHAACTAKTNRKCAGVVKVYTYDGPTLPGNITSDPRLRELNERVQRENRAFEEDHSDKPNSLFELGGRAYDASRRGLQGAGAAIGIGAGAQDQETATPPPPLAAEEPEKPRKNFARRSWDCMVSMFRECGDGE